MRAVTKKSSAVFSLALLVVFAVLAALPQGVAQIRVGPLSLLWWYGGVIAPALAAVAALGRGERG
jgi:hypothetical protein